MIFWPKVVMYAIKGIAAVVEVVVVVNFISNRVQHLHGNKNGHNQDTREIML